jgi:hypothetical protein
VSLYFCSIDGGFDRQKSCSSAILRVLCTQKVFPWNLWFNKVDGMLLMSYCTHVICGHKSYMRVFHCEQIRKLRKCTAVFGSASLCSTPHSLSASPVSTNNCWWRFLQLLLEATKALVRHVAWKAGIELEQRESSSASTDQDVGHKI